MKKSKMRSFIQRIKKFEKEKKGNLRWIVGSALGLVAALTLFIFALIITILIKDTLVDNSMTATEQSVHLSYLQLKNYHDELVRRGSIISDEIQRVDEDEDVMMEKMAEIYRLNEDVVSISLFHENGRLNSYAPAHYEPADNIGLFGKDWFEVEPGKYQMLFSNPHLQNIFLTRPMWVVSLSQLVTIDDVPQMLVVDFDFGRVGDYINRVTIGEKGYAYIAGRDGEVLYHPRQGEFTPEEKTLFETVFSKGDGTYVTGDQQYTVGYRTISNTGWKVVGVSYLEDTIIPALTQIERFTLYILLVMSIIILVISLLVSKYISQPITRMVETIQKTEKGNMDNKIVETRFNEVRQLSQSYNHLLDRVNSLMKQVKEEQAELRKSEMNVLQSQINPHFLYNTLDSILWMSERGENKETSNMVAALGKLLRISLSKGENLISLQKELAHAESYLTIQKIRYKNQFTYSIEADENLLNYLTVKIVIQPFLENALYHGIERMVDEGHISIRLMDRGECIRVEIEDDGTGIAPAELEHIQQLKKSKETGIGIRNVHQRIQVYFGGEYGVDIQSELDEGTLVSIEFPKVTSGE